MDPEPMDVGNPELLVPSPSVAIIPSSTMAGFTEAWRTKPPPLPGRDVEAARVKGLEAEEEEERDG
jgi:hypothetical protein